MEETGRPLHLVVATGQRIAGYLRLDPGFRLWQARDDRTTLGDAARTDYVLARPEDTMFDVIGRLARRGGSLAIVVSGRARIPRAHDVIGVIALDTIGEAAIDNARPFAEPVQRNPFPTLYRRRIVRPMRFWRRGPKDAGD
jgi:hypothetical protein